MNTSTDGTDGLLPCPFCGGEATGAALGFRESIACVNCRASRSGPLGSWNARVSAVTPDLSMVREALEAADALIADLERPPTCVWRAIKRALAALPTPEKGDAA